MVEYLYIIVDISGSMNEMGKINLQRNLCRYAAQLQIIDKEKYTGIDIRFFKWAENISKIVNKDDGDIPALIPKGSSDLVALSDFLLTSVNENEMSRVLILSDGNFTNSDILDFQKQLCKSSNLLLQTVAIGADADFLKLKKVSLNGNVYLSENISVAIDSTIWGTTECVVAPESINQILQSQQTAPEEGWDD